MKKNISALLLALVMAFTCFACPITASAAKAVKVISISLSSTSLALYVDGTATLKVSFNPTNATNKKVSWSTSDSDIASVKNGKVTANDDGTCTITAKSNNGKLATCTVTVTDDTSGTSSSDNYGIVYGDVSNVATPTTLDQVQSYLNTKYPSVNTPMGIVYCSITIAKAISGSDNYYGINTEFTNKSTLDAHDIAGNKNGYSAAEISETISELQELQKEIYADAYTFTPHKKIIGECIQDDDEFLRWSNYDDWGKLTGFTWDEFPGDFSLTDPSVGAN